MCRLVCLFVLFIASSIVVSAQNVIFVDYSAQGSFSGASWVNAYNDLQDALNTATPGDEIWVAKGTYSPSLDTAGNSPVHHEYRTFRLKEGVRVYGGFNGTETQKGQRDWKLNETILSGEMGDPQNDTDNVSHLVTVFGDFTAYTKLDGFTLEKAFRNLNGNHPYGDLFFWYNGCVIFCKGGVKVVFQNLIFKESTAMESFIYLEGDRSSNGPGLNDLYLVNVNHQKGSSANSFGRIIRTKSANFHLINSLIYSNIPGVVNSAIGPVYDANASSYYELVNNTIVGDTAWKQDDRALYLYYIDSLRLYNNLISGIIAGGSRYSVNNIRDNQIFPTSSFNWDTTLNSTMGYVYSSFDVYDTLNFRPRPETYGRDRGDTSWLPIDVLDLDEDGDTTERIDFDIDMNPRVSGSQVDIGAYEYFEGFVDTSAQEICVGDSLFWQGSWRHGDTVFDVSFSNGSLGDSVLRLQLQHDSINLSISPSPWGDYFTSNEADSGSTYQWIDCFFKDTIPGATSRTFHPSQNGQYQVIITNSLGCVDTSECVNLPNIGLSESKQKFKVYPNPTENEVEIWAPGLVQNKPFLYTLYSTGGQLIQKGVIQAPHNLKLNLSHLERGLYLLYIEGAEPIRIILQ